MNRQELFEEFLKETLEGFVLITVIFTIMEKPLTKETLTRIAKISVLLGIVNTVMAWVDQESHEKIKQGMKSQVGTTMLTAALTRR